MTQAKWKYKAHGDAEPGLVTYPCANLQDVDRGAAAGGGGGPGDAGGAGGVRVQAGFAAGPVQAGLRQLPHLCQARRLLRWRHVLGPRAQGGLAQLTCQAPLSLLSNHRFPRLNQS